MFTSLHLLPIILVVIVSIGCSNQDSADAPTPSAQVLPTKETTPVIEIKMSRAFKEDVLKPDQVAGRNEWFKKCFPETQGDSTCEVSPSVYRIAKRSDTWKAPTALGASCENWEAQNHCAEAQTSSEFDYLDHPECEQARMEAFNLGAIDVAELERLRTTRDVPFFTNSGFQVWCFCSEFVKPDKR